MGPAPYARDKPLSPLHEYPCGRFLFPELRISWVKGKSNSPTEKDFEGRKQKAGKKRDRRVEKKRKEKKDPSKLGSASQRSKTLPLPSFANKLANRMPPSHTQRPSVICSDKTSYPPKLMNTHKIMELSKRE